MAGLDDLYREIILDHYKNPRNQGELPSPPARRAEGFNPLCGDQLTLTVLLEDGVVQDIKITGTGCSISQSSASMMTSAVKGKQIQQIIDLTTDFKAMMDVHETSLSEEAPTSKPEPDVAKLGDLTALQGVVNFPVRIKCATLAWNTLLQALKPRDSETA